MERGTALMILNCCNLQELNELSCDWWAGLNPMLKECMIRENGDIADPLEAYIVRVANEIGYNEAQALMTWRGGFRFRDKITGG